MDDAIWQAISPEAKDPWQIFKDPCPCVEAPSSFGRLSPSVGLAY